MLNMEGAAVAQTCVKLKTAVQNVWRLVLCSFQQS